MTTNQVAYQNLLEAQRANKAREDENRRSNIAREVETNRSNVAKETETNRSNLVNERETERNNRYNNALGKVNAITSGVANVSKAVGNAAKLFL